MSTNDVIHTHIFVTCLLGFNHDSYRCIEQQRKHHYKNRNVIKCRFTCTGYWERSIIHAGERWCDSTYVMQSSLCSNSSSCMFMLAYLFFPRVPVKSDRTRVNNFYIQDHSDALLRRKIFNLKFDAWFVDSIFTCVQFNCHACLRCISLASTSSTALVWLTFGMYFDSLWMFINSSANICLFGIKRCYKKLRLQIFTGFDWLALVWKRQDLVGPNRHQCFRFEALAVSKSFRFPLLMRLS